MFELIRANKRRTYILIFVMGLLLCAVGFVTAEAIEPNAGLAGLAIALGVWFALILISYFAGDSILLSLHGAQKIDVSAHPKLYHTVEEMTIASGLSRMPDVYIVHDPAPNAFAVGRSPKKCAVAVTTGLLEMLDRDELQGVVAHELAHINNRDSLTMMTMACMLGSIVILRDVGLRSLRFGGGRSRSSNSRGGGQAQLIILVVALVLIILSPIFAQLLYFATSRRREYLADACGALYTRYPDGLASALAKIGTSTQTFKPASSAFMPFYIVRPFNGMAHKLDDLSSTHPSTEKRIQILRGMVQGAGLAEYHHSFYNVMKEGMGTTSLLKTKLENPAIRLAVVGNIAGAETSVDRHREAVNAVWLTEKYKFIACDCGTTLKIPPQTYAGQTINCPHCGVPHAV